MYVEIRFYQEPPWHYKPQQNGNHDVILNKKLKESDKQEETKTAIIVLRKNYN